MASEEACSALIVARDSDDARVVLEYFRLCDVATSTCNRVDAPGDFRGVSTVVVFPDEFSALSSTQGVRHLVKRFPVATVIVVTVAVEFFEGLASKLETPAPRRVFVFPRQIWGWTLLDRVLTSRAQTARERIGGALRGERQ